MKKQTEEYAFVCDSEDPEWLHNRHPLYTSSDWGYLFGCGDKWGRTWEYMVDEKSAPGPDLSLDTASMASGRFFEGPNLEYFFKEMFLNEPSAVNVNWLLQSKKDPLVGCTTDGWLTPSGGFVEDRLYRAGKHSSWAEKFAKDLSMFAGETIGIEMKQTETYGLKEWKEGPPERYYWQCQGSMYTTGLPACALVCKIGNSQWMAHIVTPNQTDQERALEKAHELMKEAGRDA